MNTPTASPAGPEQLQLDLTRALVGLLAEARSALPRDADRVQDALDRAVALLKPTLVDPQRPTPVTGGLAPWQVRRVTAHVEADLSVRVCTADLAAIAGLSPNHFARAFKASLGTTPHAFVVERRLISARELILRTANPLSEIALICGLADQAHLSRLFRRRFGCAPASWRRLNRSPDAAA